MDCEKAWELTQKRLDNEISFIEEKQLLMHWSDCASCKSVQDELIKSLKEFSAAPLKAPLNTEEQVMAKLVQIPYRLAIKTTLPY